MQKKKDRTRKLLVATVNLAGLISALVVGMATNFEWPMLIASSFHIFGVLKAIDEIDKVSIYLFLAACCGWAGLVIFL